MLVALAIVTSSCTEDSSDSDTPGSSSSQASDAVTRTSVDTRGAGTAKVVEADLSETQARALDDWGGLTVSVGEPVEITLDRPVPAEGIVLTRTYSESLPADAGATFGFYDDELGAWHAVPSRLSADRRTLTATVHHLSLWSDFVGWVSGAVSEVADWTTYQIGKIFDTRVDSPKCKDPAPDWISSTTFIETSRTNPLLFCTGHDTKHPDLLVVKARVNRGYGWAAEVRVPQTWHYNSTLDNIDMGDVLQTVGSPGDAAFDLLQSMMGKGFLVGPGQELSFGTDEASLWTTDDPVVLEMRPPDPGEFLVWLLAQLLLTELEVKADGLVAAAVGVSACVDELRAVTGPQAAVRAVTACLRAVDDQLARGLATVLDRRGVKHPGKVAGKIVGKLSVYLAVLGPVFKTLTLFTDARLDSGARTVSVFASHPPRVGKRVLRSAEVPANCGLPAQRLINGRTTQGAPGGGWLGDESAQVDMAGLGYRQALTTYGCHAGGVTWPETLILVGDGGTLLAHFDLGDLGQREHADVASLRVEGNHVVATWNAYEGCCFYVTEHRSEITYQDGQLLVTDQVQSYGDAAAFADAVAHAASTNDRALLLDQGAVPDEYWSILVNAIAGRDPIVTCDQSSSSWDCGVSFEPTYTDEAYLFVSGHAGAWQVDYASTVID